MSKVVKAYFIMAGCTNPECDQLHIWAYDKDHRLLCEGQLTRQDAAHLLEHLRAYSESSARHACPTLQ
jgi:hypothetical protein